MGMPGFNSDSKDLAPLNQAIKSSAISVTTSATKLPTTPLPGRGVIMLQNLEADQDVFIGDSTVTAGAGTKLPAGGGEKAYEFGPGIDVYGIVAANTADVRVLEGA